MNNTMLSIGKYVQAHYISFELGAAADLRTTAISLGSLANGAKLLIMLPLRTVPDNTRGVPFGNLLTTGVTGERSLTMLEFECKTRATDLAKDYFWNDARRMRDSVYNVLAGTNRNGLVIPRYDYTDPAHPVAVGEIWFQVDPKKGSPMEDPVEDPNDPANKSIFLTYDVHWWKPIP